MKYLLLILFILLVIFATKALRGGKGPSQGPADDARRRRQGPGDGDKDKVMLACALCGLHLPRSEALPGKGGVFCSEAHRREYEARLDRD